MLACEKNHRRLTKQTPCGTTVVVVTSRVGDRWETDVMGGQLDGWTVESYTQREADRAHDGAVQLVQGACN